MNKKPLNYDFDKIYSKNYSMGQTKKFLLRKIRVDDICHWHYRIEFFCDELIERLDLNENPRFLDLGCNIGTFAIEFARRGKQVVGIDLSEEAINFAEALTTHLKLTNRPQFINGDISASDTFPPDSFDAILAEDIFEHLHKDILSKTIHNCSRWLKPGGYLIYHTHPTKYNYLFHSRGWKSALRRIPLILFLIHGERKFKRAVDRYHKYVVNPLSKMFTGKTQEEKIIHDAHCNLLGVEDVSELIDTAGLVSLTVKTANFNKRDSGKMKWKLFGNREYFHQNLYGIAWKPLPEFSE